MEYSWCSDFSLKGAIREAIKMSGTLVGRQATQGSFTGAPCSPASRKSSMQKGKPYLDPIDDDYGTTQVSSQIVGFEISCKTGLAPQFTMDGTLYFTKILAADPEITGKISFLHDSAVNGASGEKNKWRSETPRSLQIKVEGSAFETGDDYTHQDSRIVNPPIKWTEVWRARTTRWRDDPLQACSSPSTTKSKVMPGSSSLEWPDCTPHKLTTNSIDEENIMINIDIGDQLVGQIDPEELTIDAQIALEAGAWAKPLIAWLRKYAGTTDEQAAVIGKMPLRRIKELNTSIGKGISAALDLPNPDEELRVQAALQFGGTQAPSWLFAYLSR